MYDLFFKKFRERVDLSPEEEIQIKTYLIPKKIRKRQYLLQEGDKCKHIAFVEKGALREYSVEGGTEHIILFALEGWTVADLFSFLTGEPAVYTIDALEDSELVLISKSSHEELLQTQPKYETYMRLLITDAYIALQKRLTSSISLPIEERYKNFVETYPDIVQRVPQHMIASYMGLSPETLSRVRKKMLNQKKNASFH
ncbi:Crp/Fnr family transcriptional regulator [Xanthocytophaga flava]|uniref:Crp/Fnr family transcriptional regulator n=1 Tax=Xanthocytophaga flava TaxID=3048013 RepID=UPI0028D1076A|nr:Crp/Fnr family transcriptional regulator [Xanthocytophaga flavus]MDJ1471096.1 Crp/Fnr family transcriptional regulator [Xanthocytophaga flavus]